MTDEDSGIPEEETNTVDTPGSADRTVQVSSGGASRLEHTDKFLTEIKKQKEESIQQDVGSGAEAVEEDGDGLKVMAGQGEVPREMPAHMGQYTIEGTIGRGGMGVVYRARQEGLNRVVALKLLLQGEHTSESGLHRFQREAKAMAKLRHPNIVNVHEVGEYNGQPFFTMDFIDGVSLTKFVEKVPLQSTAVVADLMMRVTDAVHYAHEQGIIHRDLKPDNILMNSDGEPVITDFGLAKDMDNVSMFSMTGDIVGTPAFMSPEQASGEIRKTDARSDVYSLGAILYWLLTSREPFKGKTMMDTLNSVVNDDPPVVTNVNPNVEGELCAICLKAMEKERDARYQTAREMADDLRRFIRGYPVLARPWNWRRACQRFVHRNRKNIAIAVTSVILIVAAAVMSVILFSKTYLEIAAERLLSTDPVIRAEAVSALGSELVNMEQIKPEEIPEAIGLMLTMLYDDDSGVVKSLLRLLIDRYADQRVLGAIGEQEAKRLMMIADSNDDPEKRNLAITAIGKIRRPEFAEYLIKRLNEPSPPLRLLIVRSLGEQRSNKALGPLITLSAKDPICRAEAQAALDKFYEKGRISPLGGQDRVAKAALRRMSRTVSAYNEQLEDLLEDGASSKQRRKDPFAGYRDALKSGDRGKRLQAVYELGLTGDRAAISVLLDVFADQDGDIGAAAAMAVARLDLKEQGDALKEWLSADVPAVRGNSALALGFSKDVGAVDSILVALANERDLGAKRKMIQALGELGSDAAVVGLEHAGEDDPRVKDDVSDALKRIR